MATPDVSEEERATSALMSLSSDCSRADWVRVAAAAKAAGVSFKEFDKWSAIAADRYDANSSVDLWRSLSVEGGITASTLFHLAREQGWAEKTGKAKRSAKIDPTKLWVNGETAENHRYIVRKGGSHHGLRVHRGALRIAGESVDGWLMVPACTAGGKLQSLQFISPSSGKKLNLPGATLVGAFHLVGEPKRDAPIYVTEGIGAAWAVNAATGCCAAVTFGAGNTARVAAALRQKGSRIVLVADRGQERAREADASRLGASWVEMPSDLTDGADIGDLVARDGLHAAANVLKAERPGAVEAGFSFSRVADMLSNGLKPISWLIHRYVEADSLSLMFGDPACGKSFAAIDLACCVATGTPWHGHKVTGGAVFYIAGEGHNGLMRRFAAWSRYNEIDLKQAPLFVSKRSARLYDDEAAAAVSEAVQLLSAESGAKPSLIVIDTLARNFGGADENSAQDMGSFIANVDQHLRSAFGACVLIVHHTGHADKSRARGSTALKGALDAEYAVTKDASGVIRIEATKMKDAEQPTPIAFRLERVELASNEDEDEAASSCALEEVSYAPPPKAGKSGRGRHQTTALRVLEDAIFRHRQNVAASGRDPDTASVAVETWRNLCSEAGIDRRRFSEVLQSLKDIGKVRVGHGHVALGEAFL